MFMRCRWQEAEREVIRTKHQHNAQWELKEMRLIKKTLSTLQAENHIWWNVWQFARFFSKERRQQQRVRAWLFCILRLCKTNQFSCRSNPLLYSRICAWHTASAFNCFSTHKLQLREKDWKIESERRLIQYVHSQFFEQIHI